MMLVCRRVSWHCVITCLQVGSVRLRGVSIVSLMIDGKERLCLAQISNTLLKHFSYNEIHNRRVALGITCVQVPVDIHSSTPISTELSLISCDGRQSRQVQAPLDLSCRLTCLRQRLPQVVSRKKFVIRRRFAGSIRFLLRIIWRPVKRFRCNLKIVLLFQSTTR